MAKLAAITVALLLAMGGAYYYYYVYPPSVSKREAQHMLDDFSKAITTKDRAKISEALKTLLTDGAQIRLEVTFYSLTQMNGGTPQIETFDKPGFLSFIDNTLYSLQDYGYTAQMKEFETEMGGKEAAAIFTSSEWADDVSSYGSTNINMRFSSETTCQSVIVFDGHPKLDKAICKMQLRSLPKAGEERKALENPEALKSILR